MNIVLQFSAATYNCNAYGTGTYSNSTCTTASGTVGGSDALAGTGFDILIPISLGLALVIAGGILITKRLLRRKKSQSAI